MLSNLSQGIPGKLQSHRIPVTWCGGLPGAEIVCCVFRAKAVKSHEDTRAVRLASPWKRYLFEFKMIFTDWAFQKPFYSFQVYVTPSLLSSATLDGVVMQSL